MGKTGFKINAAHAPDAAFALFLTATHTLGHLCRERGYGPWFEEMRAEMKNAMKGKIYEGIPVESEKARIDSTLSVIDAVFDNINWG